MLIGALARRRATADNALQRIYPPEPTFLAGDVRYAIDEHSTRFFKLGSNNRIRKSPRIERPEFRKGLSSKEKSSMFGLRAYPDRKRIILYEKSRNHITADLLFPFA